MTDTLRFYRLGISMDRDALSSIQTCQVWRLHGPSAMISASEMRNECGLPILRILTFVAYSDRGIHTYRRVSSKDWLTAEHLLWSWLIARPMLVGWWNELRMYEEIAA